MRLAPETGPDELFTLMPVSSSSCTLFLLAVLDPAPPAPAADYRERYQQLTGRSLDLCPCCGGRMVGALPNARLWVAPQALLDERRGC